MSANQNVLIGILGEKLPEILLTLQPKRLFLITGNKAYIESGAENVLKGILPSYITERFIDVTANPQCADVEKLAQKIHAFKPDLILAIGGGSVIDIAKSARSLSSQKTLSLSDYIDSKLEITSSPIPLVAVPTTAGTGAEATHFAVVYFNGIKKSFADVSLIPEYVILDQELTKSATSYQKAVSGADALCQAIESLWSIRSTSQSRLYAVEAFKAAFEVLPKTLTDDDEEARMAMLHASYLSGQAINISRTTASHAMSYPLTAHFKIPHGHAVALTLPKLFLFNCHINSQNAVSEDAVNLVGEVAKLLMGCFNVTSVQDVSEALESFFKSLKLETRLSHFSISEKDIHTLVSEISTERADNNPRIFAKEDAFQIYKSII